MITITVISIYPPSVWHNLLLIFQSKLSTMMSLVLPYPWDSHLCSPRNLPRECAWTGKDDTWSPKVITLKIITGFFTHLCMFHMEVIWIMLFYLNVQRWRAEQWTMQFYKAFWRIESSRLLQYSILPVRSELLHYSHSDLFLLIKLPIDFPYKTSVAQNNAD